jgi:hypothetical protein
MSAPKLRVVTDPAREAQVRDRLLREAIRFGKTVLDTETSDKEWIHVARARRLRAAAVAYLAVVNPQDGETP